MAQRTQVILIDDIDGGKADETVTFALDGTTYQIDLSTYHAGELRNAIGPWIAKGRRATTRAGRARGPRRTGGDIPVIRAWARAHGFAVSDRGRIPAEIRQAYEAAH